MIMMGDDNLAIWQLVAGRIMLTQSRVPNSRIAANSPGKTLPGEPKALWLLPVSAIRLFGTLGWIFNFGRFMLHLSFIHARGRVVLRLVSFHFPAVLAAATTTTKRYAQ